MGDVGVWKIGVLINWYWPGVNGAYKIYLFIRHRIIECEVITWPSLVVFDAQHCAMCIQMWPITADREGVGTAVESTEGWFVCSSDWGAREIDWLRECVCVCYCALQTVMELGEDGKLVQKQFGKVPSTITRELQDDDTMVTVSNSLILSFPEVMAYVFSHIKLVNFFLKIVHHLSLVCRCWF